MEALMIRYQAGDADAFDALYAALAPILRRHLLAMARDPSRVDDLVQETFLHLHRARATYDPRLPLLPWAYAIARHVFLMDCRHRRRRADAFHVPLEDNDRAQDGRQEERLDARRRLHAGLSRLSPGTRRSVLLRYVSGFSFREIAGRLHIAGSAARARASRGAAELRRRREGEPPRWNKTTSAG